jgi:hypothetical protein
VAAKEAAGAGAARLASEGAIEADAARLATIADARLDVARDALVGSQSAPDRLDVVAVAAGRAASGPAAGAGTTVPAPGEDPRGSTCPGISKRLEELLRSKSSGPNEKLGWQQSKPEVLPFESAHGSLTVCLETAYVGLDGPGLASALQELAVHGWNGSTANGLAFIKNSSKGTPARRVDTLTCPFSNEAGRCPYRVRVVSSGPDNDPATRHVVEVPSKATSWQHNGHDLTSATHDQVPKFLKSLVGATQLDLKP